MRGLAKFESSTDVSHEHIMNVILCWYSWLQLSKIFLKSNEIRKFD